jgi:hypothetical protein
LKTGLLIVGVLLAIIGISLMSGYGQPQVITRPMAINYAINSWNLSANLTAGERVNVTMLENKFWEQGYFEPEDEEGNSGNFLYVSIGITPVNPPGNQTVFTLLLNYVTYTIPGRGANTRLVNWEINVTQNGSLDTSSMVDNQGRLLAVGGTVPFSGTYTVNVFGMYPPRNSTYAPSYLGISHKVNVTDYPNSYFLPLGGGVTVFGGTVSVVGVATGRNQTTNRRRKIKKVEAR